MWCLPKGSLAKNELYIDNLNREDFENFSFEFIERSEASTILLVGARVFSQHYLH